MPNRSTRPSSASSSSRDTVDLTVDSAPQVPLDEEDDDSPINRAFRARRRSSRSAADTPWLTRITTPRTPRELSVIGVIKQTLPDDQKTDGWTCYLCQESCLLSHDSDCDTPCDHARCQVVACLPCCMNYVHVPCIEHQARRPERLKCGVCRHPLILSASFARNVHPYNRMRGPGESPTPATRARAVRGRRRRRERDTSPVLEPSTPASRRPRYHSPPPAPTRTRMSSRNAGRITDPPRMQASRRALSMLSAALTALEQDPTRPVDITGLPMRDIAARLNELVGIRINITDPLDMHGFNTDAGREIFRESGALSTATHNAALFLVGSILTQAANRPPASATAHDVSIIHTLATVYRMGLSACNSDFDMHPRT